MLLVGCICFVCVGQAQLEAEDERVAVFDVEANNEETSMADALVDRLPARRSDGNKSKLMKNGRSRRRRKIDPSRFDFRPKQVQLDEAGLSKQAEEIMMEADRYHMWWTGPPNEESIAFQPEPWSQPHRPQQHAIFTHAVVQGLNDREVCSSPRNLQLWLGSARRFYDGDIVLAVETEVLTEAMKQILQQYQATVYLLPPALCSIDKQSPSASRIFCGSAEERVPATAFRYFFYEKWAGMYNASVSHILIADFRDVFFQGNPFTYRLSDWFPSYQLAVFQEFYPNMVINRCLFNRRVMEECFGEEALRNLGARVIISSGAMLGTRDAILLFSHHMTRLLQEAPGRAVETRCLSGGIDHSFLNWLVYGRKLLPYVRVRVFAHGEGAMNSLGGLRPDTVHANLTGNLMDFWHVLDDQGFVRNWNGDVSPIVHQADHFKDELAALVDGPKAGLLTTAQRQRLVAENRSIDRIWQAFQTTRCLFDCEKFIENSR
jgi:hypothetical protein